MKIVSVGTVAFAAIETPFGKTDKIVGGACTYISLSASKLTIVKFYIIKGRAHRIRKRSNHVTLIIDKA